MSGLATPRDIYDVWYFLKNRFPINKDKVETRSGLAFPKLIYKCINKLENLNNRRILDDVGEFLTDSQKDWAKAKLKQETIAYLSLRKET